MTRLLTATGIPLAGLRVDGWFVDQFERGPADTVVPLGNGWVDLAHRFPGVYDPIGILNGQIVTAALTRSAITGTDWVPDPGDGEMDDFLAYPDRIVPGICGAYRDVGTPDVRARLSWTGWWDYPRHTEATALVCVNPLSPLLGVGVWQGRYDGQRALMLGTIGNPPEAFHAFDGAGFAHVNGDDRVAEVRTHENGTLATLWLDDEQVELGIAGLDPVEIDEDLAGSTLHGFAHDQHMVAYEDGVPSLANMQATPSANWITIRHGSRAWTSGCLATSTAPSQVPACPSALADPRSGRTPPRPHVGRSTRSSGTGGRTGVRGSLTSCRRAPASCSSSR